MPAVASYISIDLTIKDHLQTHIGGPDTKKNQQEKFSAPPPFQTSKILMATFFVKTRGEKKKRERNKKDIKERNVVMYISTVGIGNSIAFCYSKLNFPGNHEWVQIQLRTARSRIVGCFLFSIREKSTGQQIV